MRKSNKPESTPVLSSMPRASEVEGEDESVQKNETTGHTANVSVPEKTSRGICRFCDEDVYSDQARFSCVKGYFHAKCHKVLGKCYICDMDVRNSDLYAFNRRGHYHVFCIGTSLGNCRFCHENVYVSTGKRGNEGNGYFHDECQKGMGFVPVTGGGGGKASASGGDGGGKASVYSGDGGGKAGGKAGASGGDSGGKAGDKAGASAGDGGKAGGKAGGGKSVANGSSGSMPPPPPRAPAARVQASPRFQMSTTFFAHVHNAQGDESTGMDPPPDT